MTFTTISTSSAVIAGDIGAVVDLVLLPSSQTVAMGDIFNITIEAQCNGQDVHGVSAYVDFDPACLEVQSITPGATLSTVLQNTFSNTLGTLDYSAGIFTPPLPSGTFTAATVSFKALNPSASTSISFDTTDPRKTNVVYGADSMLRNLTGVTVIITGNVPTDTTNAVVDGEANNNENSEKGILPTSTLKPAAFSTKNLVINPAEVNVNKSVIISVTVTNTGEVEGSDTVKLIINGTVEETKEIIVAGGVSQAVSFTVSKDMAGAYDVEINGQIGEFTVSVASSKTNWPIIGGIIAIVVLIGIISFLLLKIRRGQRLP